MKGIIIIFLVLILTAGAMALDCQYTEVEDYQEIGILLYYSDTDKYFGEGLNLSDFSGGVGIWLGESCQPSFKIYNPFQEEMNLTIKYYISAPYTPLHGEIKDEHNEAINIEGYSYKKISGVLGQIGSCNIIPDEISYHITQPFDLVSKKGIIEKKRVICKECPAGSSLICKNDGQNASSDSECGSGARNVLGVCITTSSPKYVVGDGTCHHELGENCGNSQIDCSCGASRICGENNQCKDDCANPPDGKVCCSGIFRFVNAIGLDSSCSCDIECKEGACFQETCQRILDPQLRCSDKTVEKSKTLLCNIYASNTKLDDDVKVTFQLEAGSGLSFSSSQGCMNVKGNQCIGTYDVSSLSNEGISVDLNALSCGDTSITGQVTFIYKGKKMTEEVIKDFDKIHVFCCGDGTVDIPWETKENCCTDVGVGNYSFWKFTNEECKEGVFDYMTNWLLILIIVVFGGGVVAIGVIFIIRELGKLSGKKQEEIALNIQKIEKEILKKNKEIEFDQKLLNKLVIDKNNAEELEIVRERINKSKEEIKNLREAENAEKERLKEDRSRPFTNKQGYKVIINENGYEQFYKNLKYPDQAGLLFHRWYAKREIYDKHRNKFHLPWHEYEVDHMDGDRRNNELNNLRIVTKEEHKRLHNLN